jgi:2-keto-4-pentenoate hydratase
MEGVGLLVDGELAASGISAETMGSPLESLVWSSQSLAGRGEVLRSGDLVVPGAPVRLVDVPRGSIVQSRFTHCGHVEAEFV